MDQFRKARSLLAFVAVILSIPSVLAAQEAAQADFERAYFFQTHDRDPARAAAAYEEVLADRRISEAMRAEARTRLAECREDVIAADFARLMPPEVIAYAEICRPGEHFARLAEMMGLVRARSAAAAEAQPEATPLGDGAFFPHDFALSPALLVGLQAFRGAAVAVTGLDGRGEPEGLLVLHPGEADLLRGAVETAMQFAEPAEPIDGFKTWRVDKKVWVTVTARMIIASPAREEVAAAVGRLRNRQAESLASRDEMSRLQAEREGALLFAYVDGPRVARELKQKVHGHEARIMQALVDLDHIDSLSAAVRTTEDGLAVQAQLDLMDGHRNLLYGLIRTTPCQRHSLEHVPGGSAAVVLLGLNPAAGDVPAGESLSADPDFITAMDIGREFFANLEEIAVFVSPCAEPRDYAGPPIPDVGVVLIAKDATRSEALWRQLLSLPARLVPDASAREADIEGVQGQEFRFPDAPPVMLVRSRDRAVLIGTRGAVGAAIRAGRGADSLVQDAGFRPLLDRLTPTSSKAVLVHVGRVAELASTMAPGREAEHLRLAASLLANLRIGAVTDEAPTRFTVRLEASGLPNVPEAVQKLAGLFRHPATRPALTQSPRTAEPSPNKRVAQRER